jgi:hypothetical protein
LEQGKLLILDRKVNSHRQLRTNRRVIAALFGIALGLTAGAAAADTYRWTDDSGQVIYSQLPPQDGRPYSRIGAPPPPADAEGSKARLDALRQSQADRREDEAVAAEKQQQTAERDATIQQNCATARRNIETLQLGGRQMTRMPDGSIKRLEPAEREAKLQEARQYVQENCR